LVAGSHQDAFDVATVIRNDVGIWIWNPAVGLRQAFRESDFDFSTGGRVASMLSFASNSVSSNAAFLVNPERLDDLFVLGSLVNGNGVTSANNLCLWHIGLNAGGEIELPDCILRKSNFVDNPAWLRPRQIASIAAFVKNGGADGMPSQVSRDSNIALQITVTDTVARVTSAANIVLKASPYLQVQ
jgi:hypothetical protein